MKAYLDSIFKYFPIFSDVNDEFTATFPIVTLVFVGIIALSAYICVSRKRFGPIFSWVFMCAVFWPWLIVLELYPSANKEKTLPTVIEQIGLAIAIISVLGGIVFLFNRYL
ncbi:hypothetical protein [Oecophyllibacter saccharovorans]|uniref:Uncharacterized protein n=1 Tax=Oecophyllibacter saccharovorans TaxID=2558360 RepID=A0A506UM47_9PROT|nr:hypothetical protein [Oecophyllibacter saccharovorans]TPW34399.1 hypothetical protein E3202_07900 [Oecophyllibacter saccharovorans]